MGIAIDENMEEAKMLANHGLPFNAATAIFHQEQALLVRYD